VAAEMAGEQARGGGRPRSPRPVRAKWAGGQAAAATVAAAVRPPTHTHTYMLTRTLMKKMEEWGGRFTLN